MTHLARSPTCFLVLILTICGSQTLTVSAKTGDIDCSECTPKDLCLNNEKVTDFNEKFLCLLSSKTCSVKCKVTRDLPVSQERVEVAKKFYRKFPKEILVQILAQRYKKKN